MISKNEFYFSRARSVGMYGGALSEIVKLIKFRRKKTLAKRLGGMMGILLQTDPLLQNGELLIPVPLHRTRYRERGYNQSNLLAQAISVSTSISVKNSSLFRKKATKPQTDLSYEERLENVKGAFIVKGAHGLKGKRVILVDDVFTTGSTLQACTEALLEGGAEEVFCLTAAMAV
jgi:ComF family protein